MVSGSVCSYSRVVLCSRHGRHVLVILSAAGEGVAPAAMEEHTRTIPKKEVDISTPPRTHSDSRISAYCGVSVVCLYIKINTHAHTHKSIVIA